MELIWESLPRLLNGGWLTIEITAISVVIGLCFAVPLAILYLSPNRCSRCRCAPMSFTSGARRCWCRYS